MLYGSFKPSSQVLELFMKVLTKVLLAFRGFISSPRLKRRSDPPFSSPFTFTSSDWTNLSRESPPPLPLGSLCHLAGLLAVVKCSDIRRAPTVSFSFSFKWFRDGSSYIAARDIGEGPINCFLMEELQELSTTGFTCDGYNNRGIDQVKSRMGVSNGSFDQLLSLMLINSTCFD